MKLKIGVMGSASGRLSRAHKKIAFELGCAIAENDCITITGACPGFPLEAARGANSKGGLVIGISPALSKEEHIERYHSPVAYHDVLIFTGSGLMGRIQSSYSYRKTHQILYQGALQTSLCSC
jgi:predicted Rossmann-fold nucleotide-binding protein